MVDDVINELLAEKYIAFWDSSLLEEVSFYDYVNKIIEDSDEIYCTLRSIGHIAIHDEWNYWNAHGLAAHQGKSFLYGSREF